MALADRLDAERGARVRQSRLEIEFAKLSADDMRVLLDAAKDESWSSAQLIDVLKREGIQVPRDAFMKWRRNVLGK